MEIKNVIKLVKVFFIFLFIIFNQEAELSTENRPPTHIPTQNIFKKVKIKKIDLKFGKAFKEFKKKLRRKHIKEKKIKKLILLSRMSYSFKGMEKS